MKRIIITIFMILAFALSGCSEKKARELFETAQLEEIQKNYEHAGQLYNEIIKKYPETDYAKRAEERMSALKEDKR